MVAGFVVMDKVKKSRLDLYAAYGQKVALHISSKLTSAVNLGTLPASEVSMTYWVGIRADGSIEGARILRSSGNSEFDSKVLSAITAMAPFEKFSEELQKNIEIQAKSDCSA